MENFNKYIDRTNTSSIKWDVKTGELPMWVADMDFETAPEITAALRKRIEHSVYGYTKLPDNWYNSIISWYERKYNFEFSRNQLLFSPGVIGSISTVIRALTKAQDKVMVMTPVYNTFYDVIEANDRITVEHRLNYVANEYQLDISKFETDIITTKPQILILCNPHNPIGKVWTKQQLAEIGQICATNDVLVISDEIHGDLVLNGSKYQPFAMVNEVNKENSITCLAPTKTFNLAGLHTSSMVIYNEQLNDKITNKLYADGVMLSNVFGIEASIAAYQNGQAWLEQLIEYLANNKQIFRTYLNNNISELVAVGEDATYLEWVDCSQITDDSEKFASFIREQTGLFVAAGVKYRGNGNLFIRINLATTETNVIDSLKRLEIAVKLYQEQQ